MSARILACRWVVFVAAILAIATFWGCGRDTPAPRPVQAIAVLEDEQTVQVLAREGDFAQVKTADGKTGYVPASRLQAPAGSAETTGSSQVLTSATKLLDEKPATLELEPPRPLKDLMRERDRLNSVFISGDGKLIKLRPRGSGPYLDPVSKQPLWFAFTCNNPACSQKAGKDKPYLFAIVPEKYITNPDGTITIPGPTPYRFICPSCGKNETVSLYIPPESARRMKEIDAEQLRQIKQRDEKKPTDESQPSL